MSDLLKQAERCRKWRERCGWTKSEACKELGLSRPAWDAYENGIREMPRYVRLAMQALTDLVKAERKR